MEYLATRWFLYTAEELGKLRGLASLATIGRRGIRLIATLRQKADMVATQVATQIASQIAS